MIAIIFRGSLAITVDYGMLPRKPGPSETEWLSRYDNDLIDENYPLPSASLSGESNVRLHAPRRAPSHVTTYNLHEYTERERYYDATITSDSVRQHPLND